MFPCCTGRQAQIIERQSIFSDVLEVRFEPCFQSILSTNPLPRYHKASMIVCALLAHDSWKSSRQGIGKIFFFARVEIWVTNLLLCQFCNPNPIFERRPLNLYQFEQMKSRSEFQTTPIRSERGYKVEEFQNDVIDLHV